MCVLLPTIVVVYTCTVDWVLFFRLRLPPESLDQLSDSLDLMEHLQSDIPNFEAQFEPLHDQFNILRKYEVQIPEEVEHQLNGLQRNWMAFQQCLIDSESMLKKHKVCCVLDVCAVTVRHIHSCYFVIPPLF